MSKILVPSKPSWKITIVVDSQNQAQITVEDLIPKLSPIGFSISRSMNQIELALLLTNIVSSTLINTLNVSQQRKAPADAPQKTNND